MQISHNQRLGMIGTNTRATVDRIIAVWNRATPADIEAGARWYGDGERVIDSLCAVTDFSREHVAAVIAHLSPQTRWAQNVTGAQSLILKGIAPGHIGGNVERARRALESDHPISTLNGPKTRRFALNLLGDRESVTVDVWMLRVALGEREDAQRVLNRKGVYDALEYAFQVAARRVGVDPVTLQATTWVVARNGRAN